MARIEEVYFSSDLEADGPIPGRNSMLSLGSVAILRDGTRLGGFSVNLKPLPGAVQDERTMREFWDKHPEAWAAATKDPKDPAEAIEEFRAWILKTCRDIQPERPPLPVFAAYPAGFDFTFVYWYLHFFLKEDLFRHNALDMKSLAMGILRKPYRYCSKRNMPKSWFIGQPKHTHVALDDAEGQAVLLAAILRTLDQAPDGNKAT